MRVLSTSVMTRGITDAGIAIGAAAALALGVWRVSHGADDDRGAADRADGRHRGVPAVARPALGIAPGHGRPIRRRRHPRAVGGRAAGAVPTGSAALAGRPAGSRRSQVEPTRARPSNSTTCISPIPAGGGPAHDGLSFTVAAGEKIGIVGPSGSGKSSVARLLLRLFDPQSGAVRVGGHDLRTLDPEALRAADRGRAPGHLPVPRHGRGESAARQAGRDPGRDRSRGARRQRARIHPATAAGLSARSSASAASICRAASASAWRSRARCCAIRRS